MAGIENGDDADRAFDPAKLSENEIYDLQKRYNLAVERRSQITLDAKQVDDILASITLLCASIQYLYLSLAPLAEGNEDSEMFLKRANKIATSAHDRVVAVSREVIKALADE